MHQTSNLQQSISAKHYTSNNKPKKSIALILQLHSTSFNYGTQITIFSFIQIITIDKHFHSTFALTFI